MGKIAIEGATRGTVFYVDPRRLVIPQPGHELADDPSRWGLPLPPESVQSIIDHGGNEVPIDAWKDETDLIVVDGTQRTKWLLEAQRLGHEVRAKVQLVTGTPAELRARRRRLNAHRTDDSPACKARATVRMQQDGLSLEQIATELRCSVSSVRNWQKVAGLAPAVLAALDAGTMSQAQALELAGVTPEEQAAAAAESEARPKGKRGKTKRRTKAAKSRPSKKELLADAARMHDRGHGAVARALEYAAGACTWDTLMNWARK